MAAAKVVNLHTLLKYDILPAENVDSGCPSCTEPANEDDLEMLNDHTVSDTQSLLDCDDSLTPYCTIIQSLSVSVITYPSYIPLCCELPL